MSEAVVCVAVCLDVDLEILLSEIFLSLLCAADIKSNFVGS
jgi:hypothetical protein